MIVLLFPHLWDSMSTSILMVDGSQTLFVAESLSLEQLLRVLQLDWLHPTRQDLGSLTRRSLVGHWLVVPVVPALA